ncbi:MAG: DUF1016 family protein, partial [Sphingobacteriales bacterium]
MSIKALNFNSLVSEIENTHLHFQQQAAKAVNISLTVRNWLIGYYIVEFEQNGEDRALYGEKLLENIARNITIKGLSETNLKLSRQFYKVYGALKTAIFLNFNNLLPSKISQ